MRALVLLVLLSGCAMLPTHEDRAVFVLPGAYEAIDDGRLLRAREDPSRPGTFYDRIAFSAPDLDSAWGPYALVSIHWWGPSGPPEFDGSSTTALAGDVWQGFRVDPHQVQVVPGQVAEDEARRLYDAFLANVTRLTPTQRDQAADLLFSSCGPIACTAPVPALDAAAAWERAGGLAAATLDPQHPATGRLVLGSWWFGFDWDERTVHQRAATSSVTLRTGAADVVEFVWQSRGTHTDEASYQRLTGALEPYGLMPPPPDAIVWKHQEIDYD